MYNYKANHVRCIDADTQEFRVDLGFNITTTIIVRLAECNAPELRSKDLDEKMKAIQMTETVRDMLDTATSITISTEKTGKYGRWIAHVWCDDIHLNSKVREWSK